MSSDLGLRVDSEQAASEEARMARIMAGMPVQRVTHVEVDATPKQLELPFTKIIEDEDVFKALNELRKMPNYYSAKIKEEGKFRDDNATIQLTPDGERRWHEGKPAFENAIAFLKDAKPVPELTFSHELSHSAEDLVKHIGPKGLNTDMLPDKVDPPTRFSRYGRFNGSIIELLVFASQSARDCIMKCCICDGDASRSDRSVVLDPIYKVCGIAVSPHKAMGNVISIILAEGFTPKTSAAASSSATTSASAEGTDFNVNKPETRFEEVEEGVYKLTIVGAGNPPPNVTVAKEGDSIVLKRFMNGKEIAKASYGIPIPFELENTTATYAAGTLTVTMKTIREAATGTETAGKLTLPAEGSEERVGVSAGQSENVIVINLKPSKYETEIVINLVNSEAGRTTVNLEQSFSMIEDGQKCKCTATSSFRLPFTTNANSIKIDGHQITVNEGPATVAETPKETTAEKKGPTDGEIKITVQ